MIYFSKKSPMNNRQLLLSRLKLISKINDPILKKILFLFDFINKTRESTNDIKFINYYTESFLLNCIKKRLNFIYEKEPIKL